MIPYVHDGAVLHGIVSTHHTPLHLLVKGLVLVPLPELDGVDIPVLQVVHIRYLPSGEATSRRFRRSICDVSTIVVYLDVVLHYFVLGSIRRLAELVPEA